MNSYKFWNIFCRKCVLKVYIYLSLCALQQKKSFNIYAYLSLFCLNLSIKHAHPISNFFFSLFVCLYLCLYLLSLPVCLSVCKSLSHTHFVYLFFFELRGKGTLEQCPPDTFCLSFSLLFTHLLISLLSSLSLSLSLSLTPLSLISSNFCVSRFIFVSYLYLYPCFYISDYSVFVCKHDPLHICTQVFLFTCMNSLLVCLSSLSIYLALRWALPVYIH